MTVRQAARLARVGEQRVRTWIGTGRLPAVKVDHRWRIDAADLAATAQAEGVLTAALAASTATALDPGTQEVTVGQAARRLRLRRDRILGMLKDGTLTGTKVNGGWLVQVDSLHAAQQRVGQASWWRREMGAANPARAARQRATRQVLDAAAAWRADPTNRRLVADLTAAVDAYQATRRGER